MVFTGNTTSADKKALTVNKSVKRPAAESLRKNAGAKKRATREGTVCANVYNKTSV